jgi:hypothetical protein
VKYEACLVLWPCDPVHGGETEPVIELSLYKPTALHAGFNQLDILDFCITDHLLLWPNSQVHAMVSTHLS